MPSNSDLSDGDDAKVAPAGKTGNNLPELSHYPDLVRHSQSADLCWVVCAKSSGGTCFLSSLSLQYQHFHSTLSIP
jgi:hypothetical protein